MAQDPNCHECKKREDFKVKLLAAFDVGLFPFMEILGGLLTLANHEESKHGERHLIRCVTGEDGND